MDIKEKDNQEWTMVIKPKGSWFDIPVKELWHYRDLLMMFVKRDFVANYKQTILGPLWFFIQPILTTIMFTVVFGNIAGISIGGSIPKPLFYMAGIVIWNYFADCLNNTSTTFIANAGIFGKVYFPRMIVPLSVIVSNLLRFGIQFSLFLLFLGYYYLRGAPIHPNRYVLLTPFLVLLLAGLGLSLGILISAVTTKYRDLKFLIVFGVQLLMYASPVIYPLSTVIHSHPSYVKYFLFNPLTSVIEAFRFAYLGEGVLSFMDLLYSFGFVVVTLILGSAAFNKTEKTFMDTV